MHVRAGDWVVPTHAIENGGAPMLIGLIRKHALPDFQVYRSGRGRWVEVKFKDHCDKYQKLQQWQHGIDLPSWHAYLEVEKQTGIPGQLDIIQYKPGFKADPSPILLWQTFAELMMHAQIVRNPHTTFRNGAVYWPIGAFKQSPIDFVAPPDLPSVATNCNPWEQKSKLGIAPQMKIEFCNESPFERCLCHCGKPGTFGYKNGADKMIWYCADHRPGLFYADAQRQEPAA